MQRITKSTVPAIVVGILLAGGIGMAAQETTHRQQTTHDKKSRPATSKQVVMNADDLKWGPGPASLPPGAQMAVLEGNPQAAGRFVVRAKMPDGYSVPPHSHPTEEQLTVISGTMMVGMGEKVNDASMHNLKAGGFATMPANMNHYVRSKGETILQISGRGPFAIKYVNASDDPRRKTTASNK